MSGSIELVAKFENSVLAKNGKEKPIAWHNTVLRDDENNIVGILSSGQDITERKSAEQMLGEVEERYRNLIQNIPVGLYRSTPGAKGKFIMANQASARICGFEKTQNFLRKADRSGRSFPGRTAAEKAGRHSILGGSFSQSCPR